MSEAIATAPGPADGSRGRSRARRIGLAVAGLVAMGYLAIAAFLYFAQRGMLFFPTASAPAQLESLRASGSQISLRRPDAQLEGVLLPGEGEGPRPTIVYFGGNAEPVLEHAETFGPLRAAGWSVALLPYRGYDQSTGEPGAAAMRGDAAALFDALIVRDDIDPARIVAFGYSMGSGVAVSLADRKPVRAVILAAPYARLSDLAADAYPWLPVRLLFRHEFDSLGLAPGLTAPVLIFHGDADPVIPIEHGRRLEAAWGAPAQFHALPGVQHNGMGSRAAGSPATLAFLAGL